MTDFLLISTAGILAIAMLALVVGPSLYSKPSTGAWLILAVFIAEAAGLPLELPIGGAYQVYVQDLLFLTLGGIGLMRIIMLGRITIFEVLLFTFMALIIVSFIRGLDQYGLQFSANNIRIHIYFVFGVIYFSNSQIDKNELNKIALAFIVTACLLAAWILFRWLFGGAEWAASRGIGGIHNRELHSSVRAVSAGAAFIIAQTILIVFCAWKQRSIITPLQILGIVFLLIIVALPHRSVWMALIVASITLMSLDVRLRARMPLLALVGIFIAINVIPLFVYTSGIPFADAIVSAVTEPFRANSTLNWRTAGWANIFSHVFQGGLFDLMLGLPAGETRFIDIRLASYLGHAHNFYIEKFVASGIIGLTLLVVMFITIIRKLNAFRATEFNCYLTPNLLIASLVLLMVFYIAYHQAYEHCIFVGLSIAFLRHYRCANRDQALKRPRTAVTAPVAVT